LNDTSSILKWSFSVDDFKFILN